MKEYGMYFIIYGYVLPLLIMLVWIVWRVYSNLKAGEKYASYFIRDCWPLLIPGVNLWGVCALLAIAINEGDYWLKKHWKPWRMAGEQARRMFDKITNKED